MLRSGIVREKQLARRPGVDDPRAMLLMCYQNLEPPVKIPKGALRSGAPVMAAFSAAKKAGVEFWQVHCRTLGTSCGEAQRSFVSLALGNTLIKRDCWHRCIVFLIKHRSVPCHVEEEVTQRGMVATMTADRVLFYYGTGAWLENASYSHEESVMA